MDYGQHGACNNVNGGYTTSTPSLLGSCFSFVGGGCENNVASKVLGAGPAYFGTIVGGYQNCIDTGAAAAQLPANFDFVGAGRSNMICELSCYSAVVGGYLNTVSASYSFIGGGGGCNTGSGASLGNTINAASHGSAIVGGNQNKIGGTGSGTYQPSLFGFIGGGSMNCIDTTGTSGTNLPSCYGVISGGLNNVICANTCYSSILGGQGNVVQNCWATASGYNIVTTSDCAFHTNCVIAPNTPLFVAVGTYPPGALQYIVAPAILGFPVGTCMVLIQ